MKKLFFILLLNVSCAHNQRIEVKDTTHRVLENFDVINFGEFHGTQEMPDYFFSEVKKSAIGNKSQIVALGLEIPKSEEEYIVNFMKSGDDKYLKKSSFFNKNYQDGRASTAVVKGLRMLSKVKNIKIFCFDQDTPYSEDRDKVMAQNITEVLKDSSIAKVFTYSGNIHPQKKIGAPWDKDFKSMGTYLNEMTDKKIIAIRGEFKSGRAWFCEGMTEDTCGIKKVGNIVTDNKLKAGLNKFEALRRGYDATYYFGEVTASIPWKNNLK